MGDLGGEGEMEGEVINHLQSCEMKEVEDVRHTDA